MPYSRKILSSVKFILISLLAFFVSTAILVQPSNAQDETLLENGLRVIIKEDHRNPIVVFSVFIDVGAASEQGYLGSGISHLVEHMLFKGTKNYPIGAIEDILHTYGGKISGFTSHDYTGFRITILKEHRDIALDVLKEMLSAPTFDAKELKKEMQVIEREMDMGRDDPARRMSRLTFSSAYTIHPYRIPVIGYKENFKRLQRDDLVRFFKSNYTPEKIVMAVVGDIDKEEMFGDIEDLFGDMRRGDNVFPVMTKEPTQIVEAFAKEKMEIEGVYLNIAFHSTALLDKGLYAMDLLSFILGQGESSILNKKIRMEKKLALSVSSYNYTPRHPGLFVISGVLKEEGDTEKAIDEIIKELDNIKEKGVTGEDLVKAKNNFIAGYIYGKETIEAQANDLAIAELLSGNPRFFELYIEHIKSVTQDEIREAARKYLNRENMTVAVLSKSGNALNISSVPAAQKNEREIKKIVLKNNLTVLVSENPSLPILSISLLFKGGVRVEQDAQNGISNITSRMLMNGVDSMTREEIAQFYESKGMSVSTYSANNSLGISVSCLKEYIEDALKLLSHLCMDSIFPEEELERERNEIISIIEMQDNRIFNHGHRLLKESLFKVHPYRFQTIGTREAIDKIKRDDIAGFHRDMVSAENMVLGISGDCSIEEANTLAERYFSRVPSERPGIPVPEKESPINKIRDLAVNTDKEQSLLIIGFHGVDVYSEDRFDVEVMVDMLSSESGILFKSIREKAGLSYAQGAFHVLGLDPGYIAIYALTSRENIDKVRDVIFKQMRSFRKNRPSSEELQRSKNHLKAMQQVAMQTNSHFIFTASIDELYGLGYNNYKDYNKNIGSVTSEDVKKAANKYLTLDQCAILVLEGK